MNEITRLSDELQIPTSVEWNAALIYRKAIDEGLIRGRSIKSIVAAALYAACRLTRTPRSFKEIAEASTRSRKEISRCYRLLQRELDIKIPIAPSLPVSRALPKSFDKIVVHNKDGTTREVTRFDVLVLLFLELDTQLKRIETYTDERLELHIERIQELIKRTKEHHTHTFRGWHGLARTLALTKTLWLLIEESERRAKEKRNNS